MKAVRLLTKVLTIIALSVLLLGCSVGRDLLNDNEEQADHIDAELLYVGTNWKAVFNEVELLDSSFLTETTLLDDCLFVAHHSGMGQGNSLLYLGIECLLEQDTKDTLTGIVLDIPSGTIVQQLRAGSDKQLLVLAYEVKNDKTNHVLYTINVDDGSIEESKVINAWMDSLDKDLIVSLEKDNDGYVYLGDFYVNNNILVVDNEGKKAANISITDSQIKGMIAIDNNLYGVGVYQGKDALYRVDKNTWKMEFIVELPESKGTVLLAEGHDNTLLFGYQNALYQYDLKTGVGRDVYTWANIGYEGRFISSIHMDRDGNIILILKNQKANSLQVTVLKNPNKEEETIISKQKEVITIYGDKRDNELVKAVGKFNVSNENFDVEIVSSNYDRLLVDIISGNGPDLFELKQVGAKDYVNNGVIEDLTPYLEESDLLSREMLNQKVLELCTVKDVLTCIPASFSVSTLWGKGGIVGEQPGWTLEEFLTCVSQNEGVSIMEGSMVTDSGTQLMLMLWHSRENEWIDWDGKVARFEDGEFEELLTYATEYEALYDGENKNTEERWQNNKVLLYTRPITGIERFLYLKQLSEGDLVAKGYPRADGEVYHKMISYGGYAINSKSENKEGAWEFIEFLLLNQTAEESFRNGIPVVNEVFEETLIQDPSIKKNIGGYDIPIATDKDIEAFRELIDNMCTADMTSSVVGAIIQEEIEYSISGERKVAETVNIIQNRVYEKLKL